MEMERDGDWSREGERRRQGEREWPQRKRKRKRKEKETAALQSKSTLCRGTFGSREIEGKIGKRARVETVSIVCLCVIFIVLLINYNGI